MARYQDVLYGDKKMNVQHRPNWPRWISRTVERMHSGRRRGQVAQQQQQQQQKEEMIQREEADYRQTCREGIEGRQDSTMGMVKAAGVRSQPLLEHGRTLGDVESEQVRRRQASTSRPEAPDSIYSVSRSFTSSPTPSSYGFHARSYNESGVAVPSAISELSSVSQGADEDASIRPISPHSHDGSRRYGGVGGTVGSMGGGGSMTKSIYPQDNGNATEAFTPSRQRASSRSSHYPLTWQIRGDNCSDYTASISILETDSIDGGSHRRKDSLNGNDNASLVTLAPSSKMRWPLSHRDSVDTHASTRALAPSRRNSADSWLSAKISKKGSLVR